MCHAKWTNQLGKNFCTESDFIFCSYYLRECTAACYGLTNVIWFCNILYSVKDVCCCCCCCEVALLLFSAVFGCFLAQLIIGKEQDFAKKTSFFFQIGNFLWERSYLKILLPSVRLVWHLGCWAQVAHWATCLFVLWLTNSFKTNSISKNHPFPRELI